MTDDPGLEGVIRRSIEGKAKPPGALGRLEALALQIGLIKGTPQPRLGRAAVLVLAGDHGLVAEGVTAYPSAVTAAIARLILADRAGISVAAKAAGAEVWLVDCGLVAPLPPHPRLIEARLGSGTRNSRRIPAMEPSDVDRAIETGIGLAGRFAAQDADLLALGEIGIGNSSAAALVGHGLTGLPLDLLAGPGAGVPPGGLAHKRAVLAAAAERVRTPTDPVTALSEFGGFELATMAGVMIGARRNRQIAIVDGFIATAAALAAVRLDPAVAHALVFAHRSAEPGHRTLLGALGAEPLLDLGLRLGEGTGAALAIPLVRAAGLMLTDMADLADVMAGRT